MKFRCTFCFACGFPIFLLIILSALFTFFDFGVNFLCFLVCVLNLVNQGFWALGILLFDLLVLSGLEFGCVPLPEKSRYCPEIAFELSQALASLAVSWATLPSWFKVSDVITGLSHVSLSVLVSLISTTGETFL